MAGTSLALALACLAPGTAAAAPRFTECPPVDKDTGCQFLIKVTNGGVLVEEDSTQPGPYDGEDDTLIGIVNESSSPVASLPLSATHPIFSFDGDGICDPPEGPRATTCVVLARNSEGNTPGVTPGTKCAVAADPSENDSEEPCGHEPPAGEPPNLLLGEGAAPVGFASNGDAVTGYEGPRNWYSNIALGADSGLVNFSPALAPGESTYFSLEETLLSTSLTFGTADSLSSNLSGGGQSGPSITVLQGSAVTDTATLAGERATFAGGGVTYSVYSDPACTKLAASAGQGGFSNGTAAPSTAENLPPGTYYWQATYPGDVNDQAAATPCGSEVLTVQAPTTTTTVQAGGGLSGPSIPVLLGTTVSDRATISGAEAAVAAGTVTYTLYKDSKCTKALTTSAAAVAAGVAGSSVAVKPAAAGTYYWVAAYSGGGLDAASSSPCGSEKLIVSKKASLGLPSGKKCFSKRHFAIHPRFPNGAKIVRYQEFIDGRLVKEGHLRKNATSVSLVGRPKGAYKVELVTFTASGASFEDSRTFHTCVPKHKHHRK